MNFIPMELHKCAILVVTPLYFFECNIIVVNMLFWWEPDDYGRNLMTQMIYFLRNVMMIQTLEVPHKLTILEETL